jgi:hypothetical protein
MEPTNNLQETNRFIETLFFRYFKDNDGHVELRFIGQDVVSKFFRRGEVGEEDWVEITQRNAVCHVYVGVNPRPLSQAKRQDDILDVVCLWADIDGKDFEGGKEEALRRVREIPIAPSIVVDSGHGCHCYWVLAEPIIGLAGEQRLRFKRIIAGLAKELGADRSRVNLDSCLRLPGTLNIKEGGPVPCRILALTDQAYGLEEFARFEDASYQEPAGADEPLPAFGTKTRQISLTNGEAAKEDVERLEISSKAKNLIITGAFDRGRSTDKTKSGRDFSIICSLIYWDYDYATIRSVFFNPFLGCSNRIRREGEAALQWDVKSALRRVQKRRSEGTPQSAQIAAIKSQKMSPDQKRQEVGAFIVQDLLTGPEAAGTGFRDRDSGSFFFFSKEEKTLMSLGSIDFYCYMRERFGFAKLDFEEYKDAVMTAIWGSDKTATPRRFAYWDRAKLTLYVSDHDNGVYKLDGEKVEACANGVDGVFFEYDSTLALFTFDTEQDAANYFETAQPETSVEVAGARIMVPAGVSLGLNLDRFNRPDSLLKRFVIDRASFAENPDNPLPPEAQRLLLTVYIYSTFFETRMREKPVACFVGLKESGKSFLATSIGKIFFGDRYESTGLPKTAHDLAVVMEKRPYLVIDNLDSRVEGEILDVLCAAATGVTESNRTLFTDSDMTSFTPHCFLAITSREPKFTRDDLVSRLLLFSTQKIDSPISRSELTESLLRNRSAIMTEVLVNLNSIVKRLRAEEKRKRDLGEAWQPARCFSRLADWETFGRAICGFASGFQFRLAIQLMNEKKDKFAIEDDYLYLVLAHSLYIRNEFIRNMPPQDLYNHLVKTAEGMKIKDFQRRYKSAKSMTKHLANILGELKQEFEVEIFEGSSRRKEYTFKAFGDDRPDAEEFDEEPEQQKGKEKGVNTSDKAPGATSPDPIPKIIKRPTDGEVLADVEKRIAAMKGKRAGTQDCEGNPEQQKEEGITED